MNIQLIFEELSPECAATVNATTFRYGNKRYTISTTEIISLHFLQKMHDRQASYTGMLGNFETMLFVNGECQEYPFGDLPGWTGLGVFQRYETEEEARDGHQAFVTSVKRLLRSGSEG